MKKNETKVVCPVCGSQFEIAENTRVATGVVIGKDAGLGTVYPKVVGQDQPAEKLPSKATDRLEALKAAGVDVSCLFAMTGTEGDGCLVEKKDGAIRVLTDDDPIFSYIKENGDIPNWKLFRRWAMSMMFRMLAREGEKRWGCYKSSVTSQIRDMGYDYQWKQLERELYAQYKMHHNGDDVNFRDRNRWFNSHTVAWMMEDYRHQLRLHVKHVKEKKCKGIPYKNVCGENVFVSDIQKKVFDPIESLAAIARTTTDTRKLWNLVRRFNAIRKTRGWDPKQSLAWLDAYKGSGAFFTLQNLIRFHGCTCVDDSGKRLDKSASYAYLMAKAEEYEGEGWRLLGLLRKVLKDNNIDVARKIAGWRK